MPSEVDRDMPSEVDVGFEMWIRAMNLLGMSAADATEKLKRVRESYQKSGGPSLLTQPKKEHPVEIVRVMDLS
jgi:hypothetical protein